MSNSYNIVQVSAKLNKLRQFEVPTIEDLRDATHTILGIGLATLLDIISEDNPPDAKEKMMLLNLKIKAVTAVSRIEKSLLEREIYNANYLPDFTKLAEVPTEYQIGDITDDT